MHRICASVCCFGNVDGCIPLTMLVDVCQLSSFAHVWMFTAFRETFLVVKLGEYRI